MPGTRCWRPERNTHRRGTANVVMVLVASLTLTPLEWQTSHWSTDLSVSCSLTNPTCSCIAQQLQSKWPQSQSTWSELTTVPQRVFWRCCSIFDIWQNTVNTSRHSWCSTYQWYRKVGQCNNFFPDHLRLYRLPLYTQQILNYLPILSPTQNFLVWVQ